jgi:hypothetical protein
VPSTGRALTGSSSPRPAIIIAVTFCTKSGALAGTTGGNSRVLVACAGTGFAQIDQGVVHRLEVLAHHFLALARI